MPWVAGYNEALFWKLKEKCRNARNPLIKAFYLAWYNRESVRYGAYVGYNAEIKSIPELPHSLFGLFISDLSVIGENCVIFHHVTIGSNSIRDSKGYGAPRIGNNCLIGAGAKIIGKVEIGNNVRIGANCVVSKDIPDNCTVVMQSPRIIERDSNTICY